MALDPIPKRQLDLGDIDGGAPVAEEPAGNQMVVQAGNFYNVTTGVSVYFDEQTSTSFGVVAATFERWDAVVMDETGTISVIAGTPVAAPAPFGSAAFDSSRPQIPENRLPIALVFIDETATVEIASEDIVDARPYFRHVEPGSSGELVVDNGTPSAGAIRKFAKIDHAHPPNVDATVATSIKQTAGAAAGTSTVYPRLDHQHDHPHTQTTPGNWSGTANNAPLDEHVEELAARVKVNEGAIAALAGASAYTTVKDNGTPLTQRSNLNFKAGTGITLNIVDNAPDTDVEIATTGGSGKATVSESATIAAGGSAVSVVIAHPLGVIPSFVKATIYGLSSGGVGAEGSFESSGAATFDGAGVTLTQSCINKDSDGGVIRNRTDRIGQVDGDDLINASGATATDVTLSFSQVPGAAYDVVIQLELYA